MLFSEPEPEPQPQPQHSHPHPEPEPWAGWLPHKLRFRDGGWRASWAFVGTERLSDPFLHHTVARLEAGGAGWPPRRATLTAAALAEAAAGVPVSLAPAAFVLHCSRCGSTLLCNALRAVRSTVVVAEPGAVNDLLLRLATDESLSLDAQTDGQSLLQPLCRSLGQTRCGDEQRAVVKLSSWNIMCFRAHLRRAWPTVPWLFLYRDPVEVAVSQLREPSGWMNLRTSNPTAAARLFGIEESALVSMGTEEWCAFALAHYYSEAADAADEDPSHSALVDYRDLDAQMLLRLTAWMGRGQLRLSSTETLVDALVAAALSPACALTPDEHRAMDAATGTYSKQKLPATSEDASEEQRWQPDAESKRREASPELLAALETAGCFESFERLRAHRSSFKIVNDEAVGPADTMPQRARPAG